MEMLISHFGGGCHQQDVYISYITFHIVVALKNEKIKVVL